MPPRKKGDTAPQPRPEAPRYTRSRKLDKHPVAEAKEEGSKVQTFVDIEQSGSQRMPMKKAAEGKQQASQLMAPPLTDEQQALVNNEGAMPRRKLQGSLPVPATKPVVVNKVSGASDQQPQDNDSTVAAKGYSRKTRSTMKSGRTENMASAKSSIPLVVVGKKLRKRKAPEPVVGEEESTLLSTKKSKEANNPLDRDLDVPFEQAVPSITARKAKSNTRKRRSEADLMAGDPKSAPLLKKARSSNSGDLIHHREPEVPIPDGVGVVTEKRSSAPGYDTEPEDETSSQLRDKHQRGIQHQKGAKLRRHESVLFQEEDNIVIRKPPYTYASDNKDKDKTPTRAQVPPSVDDNSDQLEDGAISEPYITPVALRGKIVPEINGYSGTEMTEDDSGEETQREETRNEYVTAFASNKPKAVLEVKRISGSFKNKDQVLEVSGIKGNGGEEEGQSSKKEKKKLAGTSIKGRNVPNSAGHLASVVPSSLGNKARTTALNGVAAARITHTTSSTATKKGTKKSIEDECINWEDEDDAVERTAVLSTPEKIKGRDARHSSSIQVQVKRKVNVGSLKVIPLPAEARKKFTNIVVPYWVTEAMSRTSAWFGVNDELDSLQRWYDLCLGSRYPHKITVKSEGYTKAQQKLYDIRNRMKNKARQLVQERALAYYAGNFDALQDDEKRIAFGRFFCEKVTNFRFTLKKWDKHQYLNNEPTEDARSNQFLSSIIIETFAVFYALCTPTLKIPGIDLQPPQCALALATSAVERALSLWRDGQMEYTGGVINEKGSELPTKEAEGASSEGKIVSKRSAAHDFNYANWGKSTKAWLNAIKAKERKVFPLACELARSIAGRTGPLGEFENSDDESDNGGRVAIHSASSDVERDNNIGEEGVSSAWERRDELSASEGTVDHDQPSDAYTGEE